MHFANGQKLRSFCQMLPIAITLSNYIFYVLELNVNRVQDVILHVALISQLYKI